MRMYPQKFLPALILGSALSAAGLAQTAPQGTTDGTAQPSQTLPVPSHTSDMSPSDNGTYATGKPLAGQSKEGFWGHLNPFARKKWVNRQVDPIKDRTNELDQLQAKNANDIKDVDTRSQAGISRAMNSANTADQHALDAHNRADLADGLATDASKRTTLLNGTVSNLDQYQTVSTSPVSFAPGRTTLGPKAKGQLDELASRLGTEKGYILEVQGFSRSGVQVSQAMADSVVRYFVTEHQVPIYRIYRTGLGRSSQKLASGQSTVTNGVIVTLMHNSLATMSAASAPASRPNSSMGVSNPELTQ